MSALIRLRCPRCNHTKKAYEVQWCMNCAQSQIVPVYDGEAGVKARLERRPVVMMRVETPTANARETAP